MNRSPAATVVLHWLIVAAVVTSFLTGLRIASDAIDAQLATSVSGWLPQGRVFFWHLVSGFLLLALFAGFLVFQVSSGLLRRFRLPPDWFRQLLRGKAGCVAVLDKLSYLALLLVFLLTAITGLMNYLLPSMQGSSLLERFHYALAWFYPAFLVVHVGLHLAKGGFRQLLSVILPGRRKLASGLIALTVVAILALSGPLLNRLAPATLVIRQVAQAPAIDGVPEDDAWRAGTPVTVLTSNGIHLDDGVTPVSVQAVRDSEFVYFLFQWPDATRSQKHLPLVKTENGWRVAQTDFLRANEDSYYEDKFAVALSVDNPLAAATSIHLGRQPLEGQPAAFAERGLHYTSDNSLMDLWQWKSVRSNPNRQADDNYLGPPWQAPPQTPRRFSRDRDGNYPRFTAGYQKDPPVSWNGYAMNWEVFKEGEVKPRRLPKDPDDLKVLGSQNLSLDVSDDGDWWMEWNDTKPYLPERDHYSIGSVLPSVLIQEPMAWDRGQVQAEGTWVDGVWRLEMKRLLDTQSEYDVAIGDGVYLWVAVFDHTQTRHSRHLLPVRIRMP